MEKNVRVVDEFGKELEATYLKRAKGLVKKGRAHFIDDSTISLVCPPENMEDKILDNNNVVIDQKYIVDKIDQIMNDKDYLIKALSDIANVPESQGPGDVGSAAKADALAEVVKSREVTNQKMIHLLEKMYGSLDESNTLQLKVVNFLEKKLENVDDLNVLIEAIQTIKQMKQ